MRRTVSILTALLLQVLPLLALQQDYAGPPPAADGGLSLRAIMNVVFGVLGLGVIGMFIWFKRLKGRG